MPDVTLELFLLLAVLVGVSWGSIYSYHTPFRQVHVIGGVLMAVTGVRIAKICGL
jgi:putative Ca2+/H+ antiporter (TMEM165/GDT1 family)